MDGENWLYGEGRKVTKEEYQNKLIEIKKVTNCFQSRFEKIKNISVFLSEAKPAFDNYEANNKVLLAYAKDTERDDVL